MFGSINGEPFCILPEKPKTGGLGSGFGFGMRLSRFRNSAVVTAKHIIATASGK